MTSAYPIDLDTLTERVRARAVELGAMPTKRRVMAEFKVGRPKATAALDALSTVGFTPDTATNGDPRPERRLHAVGSGDTPPTPPDPTGPAEKAESPQATEAADAASDVIQSASLDAAGGAPVPLPTAVPSAERTWQVRSWPLLLLAAGAFVSIWGGRVGLGELTGFGPIRLLPGIADNWVINSAITLPIGVEAYAAFALRVWLAPPVNHTPGTARARTFARRSAIGALLLGMTGQIAYHLMTAAGIHVAPWPITAFVSALPVVVLGCGAALAHLTTHTDRNQ